MARKESTGQLAEQHYRVAVDSLGNNLTFGPFDKGDVIAESRLGPEVDRLVENGSVEPVFGDFEPRTLHPYEKSAKTATPPADVSEGPHDVIASPNAPNAIPERLE